MIKIAGDEARSSKITDQLKLANILKAIWGDIPKELCKTCPACFQGAYDTALKLKEGFWQQISSKLITFKYNRNSEKLNTLNKIHATITEQEQYLITEVNYLKLWLNNPHSTSESKFCTYCKKKSSYIDQCWK